MKMTPERIKEEEDKNQKTLLRLDRMRANDQIFLRAVIFSMIASIITAFILF